MFVEILRRNLLSDIQRILIGDMAVHLKNYLNMVSEFKKIWWTSQTALSAIPKSVDKGHVGAPNLK